VRACVRAGNRLTKVSPHTSAGNRMTKDSPHTSAGNRIPTEFTSKPCSEIYYTLSGKTCHEFLMSCTAQYRSNYETEIDNIVYVLVQAQCNCDAR
jgi:hypothetical protein